MHIQLFVENYKIKITRRNGVELCPQPQPLRSRHARGLINAWAGYTFPIELNGKLANSRGQSCKYTMQHRIRSGNNTTTSSIHGVDDISRPIRAYGETLTVDAKAFNFCSSAPICLPFYNPCPPWSFCSFNFQVLLFQSRCWKQNCSSFTRILSGELRFVCI